MHDEIFYAEGFIIQPNHRSNNYKRAPFCAAGNANWDPDEVVISCYTRCTLRRGNWFPRLRNKGARLVFSARHQDGPMDGRIANGRRFLGIAIQT